MSDLCSGCARREAGLQSGLCPQCNAQHKIDRAIAARRSEQASRALDIMSALVLTDGRRWGEAATEVQWRDVEAVLVGPVRRHWISRSRGFSKTSDLAGASVAAMVSGLIPAGGRAFAAAGDQDQARLLRDQIAGFARRTPELNGLDVQANRVTAGATVLEVLASDSSSAYGKLPDWLVIDEVCVWPSTANAREFYQALTTGLPKVPGSVLVVITTPGDPASWQRRVFDQATSSDLWRVAETHGPPPWIPARLVEEERRRLPEASFRRLWMGEWASPEDRLTNLADLQACVGLDGPVPPRRGVRYVIGLDIGRVKDRTVACVAHREGDRAVVDRLMVWAGTHASPVRLRDVSEWMVFEARAYNRAETAFDPHQAHQLAEDLRAAGLRAHQHDFTTASNSRMALRLLELIRDRRLVLPDDPELIGELAAVRLKEVSPNVYRLDHDPQGHDDRAVALGLAVERLFDSRVRPRLRYHPPAEPDAAMRAPSVQGPDEARMRAWTNG